MHDLTLYALFEDEAELSDSAESQFPVCPLFIPNVPYRSPSGDEDMLRFLSCPHVSPNRPCSPPENVLQVQSCAAFDKEPDYFIVPSPGSLVQRCRVGMASHRVVPVWIFAASSNNRTIST